VLEIHRVERLILIGAGENHRFLLRRGVDMPPPALRAALSLKAQSEG
jgi:hypothetical protein